MAWFRRNQTADGIVAKITKTVNALRDHADFHRLEAERHNAKVADHTASARESLVECIKANRFADKIGELIA